MTKISRPNYSQCCRCQNKASAFWLQAEISLSTSAVLTARHEIVFICFQLCLIIDVLHSLSRTKRSALEKPQMCKNGRMVRVLRHFKHARSAYIIPEVVACMKEITVFVQGLLSFSNSDTQPSTLSAAVKMCRVGR